METFFDMVSAERLPASFQPTHFSADSANVIYRFLDYRSYAKTFERAEFNQFTPGSRIVRLPGSHTKLSGRLRRQFSWPSVDRHVGRKVARVNMAFSHVFDVVWAKQASWLSMVRLVARLTEIWRATKHMARRVTYSALQKGYDSQLCEFVSAKAKSVCFNISCSKYLKDLCPSLY